jgi:hypothetical protein
LWQGRRAATSPPAQSGRNGWKIAPLDAARTAQRAVPACFFRQLHNPIKIYQPDIRPDALVRLLRGGFDGPVEDFSPLPEIVGAKTHAVDFGNGGKCRN